MITKLLTAWNIRTAVKGKAGSRVKSQGVAKFPRGVHLVRTSTSYPDAGGKFWKFLWFNRKKGSFGAKLIYFTFELIIFRFFHGDAKFCRGCKLLSGGCAPPSRWIRLWLKKQLTRAPYFKKECLKVSCVLLERSSSLISQALQFSCCRRVNIYIRTVCKPNGKGA